MIDQKPTARRLTRGHIELRGRTWWNRYRIEEIDPATGEVRRRQARMKLGRFRSAAEAGAELDRYLSLLGAQTLKPGIETTFRQAAARFDRLKIGLMRAQSRRLYRSILRNHLEPALGALRLAAIDAPALQELVASLHARGLSRATIATIIGRAREILRDARTAGFACHVIERASVKLPSRSSAEREQRHITPDELTQILEASTGKRRALWAILGLAGLRVGEALGLTWQHVDLGAGVIRIRQAASAGELAPTKTRTAMRDVPLLPQLVTVLAEYRSECGGEPTGLLFQTRTGRPLLADDIRQRWLKPMLRRLGIPAAGCHAFRHGLPGRLDALQLSPAAIQKFLGHATLTQTEHYLHRSTADLRAQLEAALKCTVTHEAAKP